MRLPPASVIASWPTPNYVNPETRGPGLLITEIIMVTIALTMLGLRLFVRLRIVRKTGWDDWLMVGAAFFDLGVTLCVILASQIYGWDIHVWDLRPDQIVAGRQVSIAGQTLFLFASGLAKSSILASYLRIAPLGSWFRLGTKCTLVVVVAAIPVFFIVLWTQCIPITSYWNLFAPERDCEAEMPPLMGQTLSTVLTDFMVFILPLPTLYALRLPAAQRIVLLVLFSFGVVVVLASAMRTYYVWHVVVQTWDVTWEGFPLWIWTAVEVNLGVIAGCVPSLKPLVYPSSNTGSSGGSSYVRNGKVHTFELGSMSNCSQPFRKTPPLAISDNGREVNEQSSMNLGTFLRLDTPPWDRESPPTFHWGSERPYAPQNR
jgi:hypothetical protein